MTDRGTFETLIRRDGIGWDDPFSLAEVVWNAATALADRDATIERLEERCAAYKGQVEAGAAEIERLKEALYSIAICGATASIFSQGKALRDAEDIARAALSPTTEAPNAD